MNSQVYVIVPPPGMKVILHDQVLSPNAMNQPPGSKQNGDQPLQTMYQTKQFTDGTGKDGNKDKRHGISILRGSPRLLGAMQIIIGLVHLTFGSLLCMLTGLYVSYIMFSQYLYWGGILFLFSGSLLVLAEHYQTSCVLKSSLLLNGISSFAAAVGIFIFLADILYFPGDEYEKHVVEWKIAQGLPDTILFFTILEFIIGIIASCCCYHTLYHQDGEKRILATHPLRMADGTVLFSSPNDVNIIQTGQTIPGTAVQMSGLLQYASQQLRNLSNQPLLIHDWVLWEKLHKVETKTLGAIQIIIGLIHIGFGSVSVIVQRWQQIALATSAGYPFWGGLFVKRSVRMNIISAVMAMVGVVLYITDLAINPLYYFPYSPISEKSIGMGLSVLLFLFSSLEIFITTWTAHFGCQATSSESDTGMMVAPYSVRVGGMVPGVAIPSPPPSYDYVVSTQK